MQIGQVQADKFHTAKFAVVPIFTKPTKLGK